MTRKQKSIRNPISHRKALKYAKALAAHERASVRGKNPPTRKAQAFIGRKIRKLAHEGMQAPRRVAAAYSLARKAGFRSVPKRARKNPRGPYSESVEWENVLRNAQHIGSLFFKQGKRWVIRYGDTDAALDAAQQIARVAKVMLRQVQSGIHENPTLAVLGNPPAKVVGTLSHRLYELRYKHAEDGKDYRHPFGPGAAVKLLADGSVWITAKHALWRDH